MKRHKPLSSRPIVGKVQDRRGRPVPHFGLDIAHGRPRPEFLFSPDGTFEIPGLVAGSSYFVRVHTPLGGVGKRVSVQPDKRVRVGTLKAAGVARTLGVSVEDFDGKDLVGCVVKTQLVGRRERSQQTTDGEGWVSFEDVPTGPTWISIGPCTVDGRRYPIQRRYVSLRSEPQASEWITVASQTSAKPGSLGYDVTPIKRDIDPLAQVLRVTRVQEPRAAASVGLKVGDVITAVGGHSVVGRQSNLHEPLTTVAAGARAKLRLADGRTLHVQATD